MKLINNNEKSNLDPFIIEKEDRPWGFYGLYSDNKKCTTKILYIKSNEMLSLQYHFKRDQFYLMLDNNFIIEYSSSPVPKEVIDNPKSPERIILLEEFLKTNMISETANEEDMFGFKRFIVHRAQYKGPRKYGRILDIAFGINDETDIVRIDDKYGRIDI